MNPYSSLERWYISRWFLFKILMQWQIFSEMFNDYANLRPWKKAADLLAQEIWGPLYDLEKLARNGVPVSAVTWVFSRFPVENWIVCKRRSRYFDDMFVVWFSIQEDVIGWPLLAWFSTLFQGMLILALLKTRLPRSRVPSNTSRTSSSMMGSEMTPRTWWNGFSRYPRESIVDLTFCFLFFFFWNHTSPFVRNLGSSECHILLTLENMEQLPLSDAMTT